MSILIVGSVAYDGIETPFGKRDRILGGSATYLSLTSSYFCDDVRLVGVVGNDFAQSDIEVFKNKGINLDGLQTDNTGKTFFWAGRYHFDLNTRDTLDTQLNVFERFNPVIPEDFKTSEYVCLGNIAPALQSVVLDQVTNPKLVILDTMNFWIEGAKDDLVTALSRVDVLIINDSEARELSGEPNLVKASAIIREMGPSTLIIKKGEHGALLFHEEQVFLAPALPLEDVFDPTGAGDTFAGGFAGYLTQSENISFENMKNAIIQGSNLASFCVEKFGTERMVDLDKTEVVSRLQQFKSLTQFDIEL